MSTNLGYDRLIIKDDISKRMKPEVTNYLFNEDFIRWRLFHTEELEHQWEEYQRDNPHCVAPLHEAITLFDAVRINRYPISEEEKQHVYKELLRRIAHKQRRRKVILFSSVAASFLIGMAFIMYTFLHKKGDDVPMAVQDNMIIGQTLPEEDVHLLSAGERINLSNHARIDMAEGGKVVIMDNEEKKELQLTQTGNHQLVVPYGKRSNITLSDGTVVWVNSGTRLDFPGRFTQETRTIRVDGEIFIQVAHNPRIPFIVEVEGADVHVKGTSFNISAYSDEDTQTIVLVEGTVHVTTDHDQSVEMQPNDKIDIKEGQLTKEVVDVREYISWKNGVLEFKSTPMSEILKKVGRYYNVHFEETPGVKLNAQTFTGKLFLSNNLDSVMTSVSILSSTTYERRDNIIQISNP